MSIAKNLLAGLGGAIALNILHESLKRVNPDMPRIDLIGEEALQKTMHGFGTHISSPSNLYNATFAADLISNSLYYSAICSGKQENIWAKAIVSGLAAGIGAVVLPKPMGLNHEPVTKSIKTKALTVGYYVAGALVTVGIISILNKKAA